MPASNFDALRDWAAAVIAQLPPESESYPRAEAATFLLGWATDAHEALLTLRPYIGDFPQIADQVDELLIRWGREVA